MVNYSCDKCYKTFTQKSHYTQHQNEKISVRIMQIKLKF